jgi:hypothetical protein
MRQRVNWTQIGNFQASRRANRVPFRAQPKDNDRLRVGANRISCLGLPGSGEMLGCDLPGARRRGHIEQATGCRREYRTITAMDVTLQLCARSISMDSDAIPAVIQRDLG